MKLQQDGKEDGDTSDWFVLSSAWGYNIWCCSADESKDRQRKPVSKQCSLKEELKLGPPFNS
eukprot:5848811-Amphidinium_carterae.1